MMKLDKYNEALNRAKDVLLKESASTTDALNRQLNDKGVATILS